MSGDASRASSSIYYYYKSESKAPTETDSSVNDVSERDWQEEWSSLLDQFYRAHDEQSRITISQRISELSNDFVSTAKRYGKLIIQERSIPDKMKTIKPIQIGGVAGGVKYICRGILFKFSVDTYGIYGSDEAAMKAAAHELVGVREVLRAGVDGVIVPLMALVEYRGLRLIAMSILPLTELVYGSCDGGRNVYNVDSEMDSIMQRVGKRLNLKPHLAGSAVGNQAIVYGPADCEGHRGEDGRLYLLDFQRIMPPEWPNKGQGSSATLYKLLRPEFVRKLQSPLSSDAATSFSKNDPDFEVHNDEIKEATRVLKEELIPQAAARLDALAPEALKSIAVSTFLKKIGVNLRYLGLVRSHCRVAQARSVLLHEMLVRCLKDQLKKRMRECVSVGHASSLPLKQKIVEFLNEAFGASKDAWWTTTMRNLLIEKYQVIGEHNVSASLTIGVDLVSLFNRLDALTGVRIAPHTVALFAKRTGAIGTIEFVEQDVEAIQARTKHNNLIENSDAISLVLAASRCVGQHQSDRLLRLGLKRLHDADTVDLALLLRNCHPSHRSKIISVAVTRLEMSGEGHEQWFGLAKLVHELAEDATGGTPSEQRDQMFRLASDYYRQAIRLCKASRLSTDNKSVARVPADKAGRKPLQELTMNNTIGSSNVMVPQKYVDDTFISEYYFCWANLLYAAAQHGAGDEKLFKSAGRKYSKAFQTDPQRIPQASSHLGIEHGQLLDASLSDQDRDIATLVRLLCAPPTDKGHTEIDLQQCPSVTDSFLLKLGQMGPSGRLSAPRITAIRLATSLVSDKVFVKCVFPNLRHLDLRECRSITEATLFAVSRGSPLLETVNLSGCRISDGKNIPTDIIPEVVAILRGEPAPVEAPRAPSPTKRTKSNAPTSPVKKLPVPQGGSSQNTPLGKRPVQPVSLASFPSSLLEKFGELKFCTSFSLNDCAQLSDPVVYQIIQNCPSLLELHLSGCGQLSTAGLQRIFFTGSGASGSTVVSPDTRKKWQHRQRSSESSSEDAGSNGGSGTSTPMFPFQLSSPGAAYSPGASPLPEFADLRPVHRTPQHRTLRLQTFDVSHCKNVGWDLVGHVAAACSDLQTLRCAGALGSNTSSLSVSLHSLAFNCPNLRVLRLGKLTTLDDADVRRIAQSCPLLEGFEVTHALALTSTAVSYLSKVCLRLTTVGISFCKQIGDDAVVSFARNNFLTIRTLRLAGLFKLTDISLDALGERCKSLQHLEVDACEGLTEAGISRLTLALPDLRTITLRDCHISSAATLENIFSRALSQQPSSSLCALQRLSIAKLPITDHVLAALGKLAGLYGALQSINLSGTRVSDQGLIALARNSSNSLRALDLSGCSAVTDDGIARATEFCPIIDSLILDGCSKISDPGLIRVASSAGASLRLLSISGLYKVTDLGIIKVSQSSPSLRNLDMSFVYKCTDASVSRLFTSCRQLQSAILSGCRQLTDALVDELVRKPGLSPALIRLDLDSCPNISRSFIFQLRRNRPDVEVSFKS